MRQGWKVQQHSSDTISDSFYEAEIHLLQQPKTGPTPLQWDFRTIAHQFQP